MNPLPPTTSDAGYSPNISAELLLHDQSFAVLSLGPGQVVIQSARPLAPGFGMIHVRIDRQLTVYHVEFPVGISPEHSVQPIVILKSNEEEAAA